MDTGVKGFARIRKCSIPLSCLINNNNNNNNHTTGYAKKAVADNPTVVSIQNTLLNTRTPV